MHSIRLLTLLMIGLLFLSFNFFKSKPRDYADIAREISGETAQKLAKKHQMDCIGVGGGMMESVYMIGLSFQIHHPMDRNEARDRLIDSVETLLIAINENEEIRPFLKNYPFTTKNIHVSIYTNYPNGKEVFDPYIRVVSLYLSDDIYFSTKEANKDPYKHQYRESYREALTLVKAKKNQN